MKIIRSILLILSIVGALGTLTPTYADTPTAFLRSLCEAGKAKNDEFLKNHVRFPLKIARIASEGAGNPIYKNKSLKNPQQFREEMDSFCDEISWDRATSKTTNKMTKVHVTFGQFIAEFTLMSWQDSFLLVSFKV